MRKLLSLTALAALCVLSNSVNAKDQQNSWPPRTAMPITQSSAGADMEQSEQKETKWVVRYRKGSNDPWEVEDEYSTKEVAYRNAQRLHKQGYQVDVRPAGDPPPNP